MQNIITDRLILRSWKEEDLEPFAKMNADPQVMECYPSTLSTEESNQMLKRMQAKIEVNGWGLWAVSAPGVADLIGYIGLNAVDSTFPADFNTAIEIGWRLGLEHWGRGFATEGAKATLKYGFKVLHLEEIVSFTATQNKRSRAVMERIGMHRDPKDDFDHPRLPEGHPLRRHVLYRLKRSEWEEI